MFKFFVFNLRLSLVKSYFSQLQCCVTALRKLDMVQHCKWIAYGTDSDGLGGEGCTRMRPKFNKLHLPVLGHAFRLGVTGARAMA